MHSSTPGSALFGHHLKVRNPSVCSPGMPCQVLWSDMLGVDRGGQLNNSQSIYLAAIDKYASQLQESICAERRRLKLCVSPLPKMGSKGVQNQTLTSDSLTCTITTRIASRTPLLVFLLAPGRTFSKSPPGRVSFSVHLGTNQPI